jgi:hypothetical protein
MKMSRWRVLSRFITGAGFGSAITSVWCHEHAGNNLGANSMSSTRKAGDVLRSDFQSDPFGGQYKLVERVQGARNTWIIEYLPADEQTQQAILDHWAAEEARSAMTLPVWNKTWRECDASKGERPQRIGWLTYEEMLERDLRHYEENAGRRAKTTFVSAEQYAEYF